MGGRPRVNQPGGGIRISVGIDIAKEIHRVTAIDADGVVHIGRKLENAPAAIASLIEELHGWGATVRVGLDVVGGIAGLAEAMLSQAGFALVHVPGLAADRARQGTVGGENKSDPRDARTIAEQVHARRELRPIVPASELDLEIGLLVARRSDLVAAQTRRLARLHDLLVGIFPGLERCLDLAAKGPLHLLTRHVTPAELRSAGKARVVKHLQSAEHMRGAEALADKALAAAEQTVSVPAERMTARLVRELEKLLDRHPCGSAAAAPALIRSLPGMGAVLAAELIAEAGNLSRFRSADALASAGGIAPVLKQSGKTRFLRRPAGGNKSLKRVVCQSAFCSLGTTDSRAFHERKRREGKRHHQAIIALARRRVNVLWAILQSRTPFQPNFKAAA